ncbi:hypothetical protein [Leptotrichia massiliensis]|uniref:hypothetical protein n=1 Tax=Leptotrichia massiliensis TaxID=1852388 RepID=UPI0028E3D7AA|nr:hypothetical protein [Leptotrichia massiliensis]
MFYLEYFINHNYKILKFLYDNQIQVKDEYYIVLSQQEIADMEINNILSKRNQFHEVSEVRSNFNFDIYEIDDEIKEELIQRENTARKNMM